MDDRTAYLAGESRDPEVGSNRLIPRALTAALGGLPGTDIWTEVSLQGRKGKTHLDPRRRTKPSASAVTQEVAPPTCGPQGGQPFLGILLRTAYV